MMQADEWASPRPGHMGSLLSKEAQTCRKLPEAAGAYYSETQGPKGPSLGHLGHLPASARHLSNQSGGPFASCM